MGSVFPSWIVSVIIIPSVAVGAIALALSVLGHNPLRLLRGLLNLKRNSAQLEAEEAFRMFFDKLQGVRHKSSALNVYASQYFTTFQSAGWDEMTLLLDDLEIAENSLRLFMERRRYEDVRDVSRMLLNQLSEGEAIQLMSRYDGLENLRDWQLRSNDILLRVIEASLDSARKTASVGVSRKRSTKPTLLTLAELRSAISEGK